MKKWTWGEIKTQLEDKHDLENGDLVDETELMQYVNDGIDIVEGKIQQLSQDYFLDYEPLDLVQGQSEYSLPDTIYAHKIRRIVRTKDYNRVDEFKVIKDIADIANINARSFVTDRDTIYNYKVINSAVNGVKLLIAPTPEQNITGETTIYYLRNAYRFNSVDGDSQESDIPEFISCVMAHASKQIYLKDKDFNALAEAKDHFQQMMGNMVNTLAVAIDDEDTEIEPDMSFYEDMDV